MAINIYSGNPTTNKNKSRKTVNSAAASTRASKLKAQVPNSEVSNSGTTAVKSNGTLSKVGSFIGKAANVASKFLPGLGGTIAKGLANIFNDPEWWESVPGDGITLNEPLRAISLGNLKGGTQYRNLPAYLNRPTFLEVVSTKNYSSGRAISITDNMITQYLMPQVRKMINAIPLQDASDYSAVLACDVTAYALFRQLKKCKYFVEHGLTYIPNTNSVAYPILQVENSATLDAFINRLEEFLRANVRLPHTMCEYLAWRFGRIYKTNDSAKSGLVMYNVIPMASTISDIKLFIDGLFAFPSSMTNYQKAQSDIYTCYYNHDMVVEITDDSQYKFDKKEWMLRINLDLVGGQIYNFSDELLGGEDADMDTSLNPIQIDSSLDNATVFMASSVSTLQNGVTFFPVVEMNIHYYVPSTMDFDKILGHPVMVRSNNATDWAYVNILPSVYISTDEVNQRTNLASYFVIDLLAKLAALKAVDVYNAQQYVAVNSGSVNPIIIDVTAIDLDLGTVSDTVINNEHIYAFANLMNERRTVSTGYKTAEKQVTRDLANLVDSVDVTSVH